MGVNQRHAIKMSPQEVEEFLHQERTASMCTMHPDGSIHAIAMWYAFLDGALAVETKRKSQKVQNLRRDPRITFLVEAGDAYEELRGVELAGTARIVDNDDQIWSFGVSMFERYVGPYSEEQRAAVELMMNNRVVVAIDVAKVVSWDHRKLGQRAPTSAPLPGVGASEPAARD